MSFILAFHRERLTSTSKRNSKESNESLIHLRERLEILMTSLLLISTKNKIYIFIILIYLNQFYNKKKVRIVNELSIYNKK